MDRREDAIEPRSCRRTATRCLGRRESVQLAALDSLCHNVCRAARGGPRCVWRVPNVLTAKSGHEQCFSNIPVLSMATVRFPLLRIERDNRPYGFPTAVPRSLRWTGSRSAICCSTNITSQDSRTLGECFECGKPRRFEAARYSAARAVTKRACWDDGILNVSAVFSLNYLRRPGS